MAKYKEPRSINFVSVGMFLLLAAVIYGGWKFGPPYYRARQVDKVLDEIKRDAGRFVVDTGDPREGAILQQLRREVLELGVDEGTLQIYFALDHKSLNVKFTEIIEHPIGDPMEWEFHRKQKIVPVGR
ncbi:MAG: hypothetical protein GY811_03895 [Myxococcales bacterium]|nr:hypothetical protein [Myxococcales bacterium]